MAENRETTIIDVKWDAKKLADDMDALTLKAKSLRDAQAELREEIKNGGDENGKLARQLQEVGDELSWTNKQMKGLSATTKLLTADNATYSDNLNGMRQKLADMQKAYAQLSAEQRDSEGGKAFVKAIKDQSDAVKTLEAAMGDHRRNVGNYTEAVLKGTEQLKGFFAAMKAGKNPMDKFTLGLNAIGKTPVLFILDSIIKVLVALSDRFRGNAAAMESLTKVFGAFQGVGVIVDKLIDGLAKGFGWLADKLMSAADAMGLITDEMRESQRLAEDELGLNAKQRDNARQNAEDMQKIADLRAKANEKDKVSTAERLRLLQEASDMEEAIAKRNAELAKEAYDLQVAKNAQSESSQADLEKENDLYIEMLNAQTSYLQKQREINGQMSELRAKQAAEAKAAAKAREDEAKRAAELAKKQADDERDIRRAAEDLYVSMIQDETEKKFETRRLAGERELDDLRERLMTEKTLTETARAELAKLIADKDEKLQADLAQIRDDAAAAEAEKEKERAMFIAQQRQETVEQMRQETDAEQAEYEEARWQAQLEVWRLQMEDELAQIDLTNEERAALQAKWDAVLESAEQAHQNKLTDIDKKAHEVRKKNEKAAAMAAADFMGTLSDILAEYGEDNKAAAIASKALALGKIGISTGVAIAEGVAQAQSVPFPANIAAIATTISTVLANVATAVSTVKAAKFSTGTVVGGGSYGQGDTVPALLSPQEVVLNPTQTAQTLFAIANGAQVGSNAKELADVVVAAVAAQPAPVMDYQEFTTFEGKVATFDEIAAI